MTPQLVVLTLGLSFIAYLTLNVAGVFDWVNRKLTYSPPPEPVNFIRPGAVVELKADVDNVKAELANQRSDIDKMKIALGIKELRRG